MQNPTLTPVEKEIIQLTANGLTIKAIADTLHHKEPTIETYRTNLLRKLQVTNAPQLIAYAFRNGILNIPPAADAEELTIDVLKDAQGEFYIEPELMDISLV